ncbi:MAG: hypothetical protein ACNS63_06040 [Candidatus Nitrospinota bacterium M3_3B_026]
MKKLWTISSLAVFLFGTLAGACATIVGDKTQLVPINSSPDGAVVKITDEKGMTVFKGSTPTTVTLNKSDGSYFGGKSYSVKISKDGYESRIIGISSSPNGWYLAGNLIFGGLIGWFIIDPMSGAMYTLAPEQVSTELGGKTAEAGDNSITVMLLEDVPNSLRSEMKRIN